jgi:alpha-1,2-mannosyltransferase
MQRLLKSPRIHAYCGTALLTFQIYGFLYCAARSWKEKGHPDGYDFQTFWAASRLTLQGTPLRAYDWHAIKEMLHLISPSPVISGPWFYPPNFLLLITPAALIPSPISYLIFETVTTAIFIVLMRRAIPVRGSTIWILAFPGLWLNFSQGQNAALTASLALGSFLAMRERRDVLAGILIGLLSIKPHLAVLFPIALACAGMRTTFVAAAVTATLFTAVSIGVFGVDIVPTFFHGLSEANDYVASGILPWEQLASLFASLRALGVPASTAYVVQASQAVLATVAVAYVWRNSKELELRAITLVSATFLTSPYIYNYDALWLGISISMLSVTTTRNGWLRWERLVLAVAWLYPQLGNQMQSHWKIGFGSLVFAALIAIALRRMRSTAQENCAPVAAGLHGMNEARG